MNENSEKNMEDRQLFEQLLKEHGLAKAWDIMVKRAREKGLSGLIDTNNHHEAELEYETFRSRLIQYGKLEPGQDLEDCKELTEEEVREWKEYKNAGKSL